MFAGTIVVYGQTGAGKTYTMDAFTQLVLQQLFSAAASRSDAGCEASISISAVELYNEALRCLLCGRDDVQMRMMTNNVGAAATGTTGLVLEGAEERVTPKQIAAVDVLHLPWIGSHSKVAYRLLPVDVWGCSLAHVDLQGKVAATSAGRELQSSCWPAGCLTPLNYHSCIIYGSSVYLMVITLLWRHFRGCLLPVCGTAAADVHG
jgi:hypothetical protein